MYRAGTEITELRNNKKVAKRIVFRYYPFEPRREIGRIEEE
jgi:hypothetical protein